MPVTMLKMCESIWTIEMRRTIVKYYNANPNTKHHFTGVCQHLSTTRHKILTGNEMPTVAIQHSTLKKSRQMRCSIILPPENFGSFKRISFIQCKLHRNHHIGVSIIVFNNRSSRFDCPYAFTHLQHRNWHILVFRTQNSCDLHCPTVCDQSSVRYYWFFRLCLKYLCAFAFV